ncbi:hypothetical protein AB0I22_01070 [Streptomyces sp. NPDC050610]|uniref:hypothetical protein n=1 Tax=Streptomyces sp. NPDC050610 TaxID=3157097 RepID=UPI00341DFECA
MPVPSGSTRITRLVGAGAATVSCGASATGSGAYGGPTGGDETGDGGRTSAYCSRGDPSGCRAAPT